MGIRDLTGRSALAEMANRGGAARSDLETRATHAGYDPEDEDGAIHQPSIVPRPLRSPHRSGNGSVCTNTEGLCLFTDMPPREHLGHHHDGGGEQLAIVGPDLA